MARIRFQTKMLQYELANRHIVYLDESGFAVDTPRTHGYAPRGERCYGSWDWHARGRLNAIGAIIGSTFLTVTLFDSYVDSEVFYAWVTQGLLPKLPPHSVVVMDNASFHKCEETIQAIEQAGHTIEFLPTCSSDLNPIEKKWAQAKAIRKQLRCDPYQLFLHHKLSNFKVS